MTPKVTIYIAAHNYGRFLGQAIESVLAQTFDDFELLVFDDGSTDSTGEVLAGYTGAPRVKVLRQEHAGLAATANRALTAARGEYFVRLDADDFLDESFLLVLAATLDKRRDVDLVYSDYYEIDEAGDVLGVYRRKKLGTEALLLDLPSHGACTMYRTEVLSKLGGYWEDIVRQDGMGVWVRFIQEHKPSNINLPLFYYRKHAESLTTHQGAIHDARAKILEKSATARGSGRDDVGLVLPVRRASGVAPDLALTEIAGAPLVHYALRAALEADVGPVAVVTEDDEIAAACASFGAVDVVRRTAELALPQASTAASIALAAQVWAARGYEPQIVGTVFYTSPLTTAQHLRQAVNTMAVFGCSAVVAVRATNRLHYTHEALGLSPLFQRRGLKHERDVLYEESGAFVFEQWPDATSPLRAKIGHVVLSDADYHRRDRWKSRRRFRARRLAGGSCLG